MRAINPKQAGDLVQITGGAFKGQVGILQEKVSKGWNIKLPSGEVVLALFPFVKLIAKQGEFEVNRQTEQPQDSEPVPEAESEIGSADEIAQDAPERPCSASGETGDEIAAPGEDIAQTPTSAAGNGGVEDSIAKLTILQLRDLAKRKGVSVARTKADFLSLIKEKNPDEDLEQLKGKVLFDRVSELHISRLRSKEDLQKLLAH